MSHHIQPIPTLGPASPPARLRIRSPWAPWALRTIAALLGALAYWLAFSWASRVPLGTFFPRYVQVGVALGVLASAALNHWRQVVLTPQALVVRGPIPRHIPWSQIVSIASEPGPGGTIAVVVSASGRRTRLGTPSTGRWNRDRNFQAKVQMIHRWHEAATGSPRGVLDSASQ